MKKKQKLIGGIVLASIILCICVYKYIEERPKKFNDEDIFVEEVVKEEPLANKNDNKNKITVEIKGEVNKPGVYSVKKDSILKDLINEAGGPTEKADLWNVNGAEILRANVSYKIPARADTKEGAKPTMSVSNPTMSVNNNDGKININAASEKELDTLPGIGKTLSEQIVTYRNANGPFRELADLKKVNKRISDKILEEIKDKVVVN